MKKQSFIKGSSILIISVIVAKIFGAIFKIPLTNILGGEGMGFFSSAYGLFLPIYAMCATGLTTAVAKLTADNIALCRYKNARRIRNVSLIGFSIAGLFGTVLMCIFARPFAEYVINSPKSFIPILMLSPAVFFGCITSVYRGYFEGLHNMTPTAVSQVTESIVKLIFGLVFCVLAAGNAEYLQQYINADKTVLAAGGAVLGVTVSCLFGCIYIVLRSKKDGITKDEIFNDNFKQSKRKIAKNILKIFIPVALGALVTNLTSLIDLATIIRGLNKAIAAKPDLYSDVIGNQHFSDFVYGAFLGLAITIFNIVPSLTNMFGKGVFPGIAEAHTKNDSVTLKKQTENALFATMLIAAPCGLGIFVLARPALMFLFPARLPEVEVITGSLSYLGLAVILCCLSFPLFSIFQAVGRTDLPVKIMLFGVIVKLAGNLILIPLPKYNINGAAISTVLCYLTIVCISLIQLRKITPVNYFKTLAAPIYAALLCAAAAVLAYSFTHNLPNIFALPISVGVGALVYALSSWCLSLNVVRVSKNVDTIVS